MLQSPKGCAIIGSHRVEVLVLLRCSGCTTLHPLRPPFIGLYSGNPHSPLASLSHGDFRDRENANSYTIELLEAAIQHKVPFSVLLFDSWYLAEELVSMARYRKKDWISLLKKNRNLETHSFTLKDAAGDPLGLEGPQIAVEDLVPLIPPPAYRGVTARDKTYWTFTLAVRLPGLGKVRLVVSFKSAELTGTYVV